MAVFNVVFGINVVYDSSNDRSSSYVFIISVPLEMERYSIIKKYRIINYTNAIDSFYMKF